MPVFTTPSDPAAITALAVKLWGEPNRTLSTRDELRFGTNGSKSVKPQLGVFYDHEMSEGGHYRDLYKLVNGSYPENGSDKSGFLVPPGMRRELGNPSAWWDYHDAKGAVVARVVRFEPNGQDKTYRQCRPDGAGWVWKMDRVQIPLYRLPALLHAPKGSLVYAVEGEKHADRLRQWGLIATTNAGGAGKFRSHHAHALAGHTVVVLPDNDDAGRKHRDGVMGELRTAGIAAHVLELPNLPHKGDVLNWIEAGGTLDQLARLTADVMSSAVAPESTRIRERTSAAALLQLSLPPEEHLLGSIITRTARVFLVGSTGTGKTMLGLALAGGVASGEGFLHWRSCRRARVLYIDGEMPLRGLQSRVRDLARRLGGIDRLELLHFVSWQNAAELGMGEWAPLNTEAGQAFVLQLCDLVQPDLVIFDNVQALVTGDMKDEVPWNEAWPLISTLTSCEIGQVWIDHTGHNTTRQYGTSTKAWRFDTVGIMTPLADEEREPGTTGFTLSFEAPGKARNRTPENWNDYATATIRLRDDVWAGQTEGGGAPQQKIKPSRKPFYEALTVAITRTANRAPGETTMDAWEIECVRKGLIEGPGAVKDGTRRIPLRRAQSDLITSRWISVDGDRVFDLQGRWE